MAKGLFTHLAHSYLKAAGKTWRYLVSAAWLLKPVILPLVVIYWAILVVIGLIFYLGILIDLLSKLVDGLRNVILNAMRDQSRRIDNSFIAFLWSPIWLTLLAPLLLLSLITPKFSSDTVDSFIADNAGELFDGAGTFKIIRRLFLDAAKRLFDYVASAPLLLKPLAALIAIVYSLVLMAVACVFMLLIPLDWLSALVETMRQKIAKTAYQLQMRVDGSLGYFLFIPPLLAVLAPVFVILLSIPKITTQLADVS